MNNLLELGIDTNIVLEVNPFIKDLSNEDIKEKIDILNNLGCNSDIIKNVIETNPLYLTNSKEEVIKLINKLMELGIKRIDITIDSNPYILNNTVLDLEGYINNKRFLGYNDLDILDFIDGGML